MKKRLLVPLACLAMHAHAATYYLSSVSGSDARTASQARNPETPWRTLTRLNLFFSNLQPGDSVLFKRGETFYGQLDITQSGFASRPIVISAYGMGAKPIITGFTTIKAWVNLGAGIWESTAAVSLLPTLDMVTINGSLYAMGRYPNANAPNKGYLTIDSHRGSTSITCAALPASPDWDGARLVLRTQHYILDTSLITSHSGTTIHYSTPPFSDPTDGYGFFIENHPRTLDQFGEWYFNRTNKKLQVYFGDVNPSTTAVKVATVDTPVRCFNENYITFDNLNIQGANENGISIYSAKGVQIKNCDILFCANAAIDGGTDDVNLTIENNLIADAGNYGMDMRSTSENQVIRNNTVKRIGLFPGMGGYGTQSRTGIVNNSSQNHRIENNRVDSVGYIGIRFGGDYTVVKNNVISNFTLVLDDGSGIYTANHGGEEHVGRKVLNNLIYNGIGAKEGTTSEVMEQSSGIYTDDNSSGIEISGNSVWNCGKVGLFVHNAFKINIHENTFYNNTSQILLLHDNTDYPALRNLTLKKNISIAKTADQDVAYFYTLQNDIASFGSIDSNFYARPVDDDTTIIGITNVYVGDKQVKTKYTLATWKLMYGQDAASKKSPKAFPITVNPDDSIRFEYNETANTKTVVLDANYMDVEKNTYTTSLVLQPYSSVVLMRTITPPGAPKPPSVSLTSPTVNANYAAPAVVTLTANASDADGHISKVEFYNGATLLAAATTSPYSFSWTNVTAGSYTITAKATDNSGLVTTSGSVAISVNNTSSAPAQNKAPSISLTSPTATTGYIADASIELKAAASDADGTISKVEFYNGTSLLATVMASPYRFVWQNIAAGTYSITAKATDNAGLTTSSAAVSILVATPKPPTVTITNPSTVTHFMAPATIDITADANDSDGQVSKVEFFNGTTLLATKTTAPYLFSWQDVDPGTYTLTAKATDNSGLTATSHAVSVQVTDEVSMQLVPNPVHKTLYITINGLKKNKNVEITILSISGSVVKTIKANAAGKMIKVDVSLLPPQVYTVVAASGFTVLSGQFVKL